MMRMAKRKLRLDRETLVELEAEQLAAADGGTRIVGMSSVAVFCYANCQLSSYAVVCFTNGPKGSCFHC